MYCVQQTLWKISSKCSTRESGQQKVTVLDAGTLCLLLFFFVGFFFPSRRIFFQAFLNKTHLRPLTSLTIFLCGARLHVGGWYSLPRFPSLSVPGGNFTVLQYFWQYFGTFAVRFTERWARLCFQQEAVLGLLGESHALALQSLCLSCPIAALGSFTLQVN